MNLHEPQPSTLSISEILDGLTEVVDAELTGAPTLASYPRRLAAVQTLTTSLLSWLMKAGPVGENDDCLHEVIEADPHYSRMVDALEVERVALIEDFQRFVRQFAGLKHEHDQRFYHLCNQIRSCLNRLAQYRRKESSLFQEALDREVGGEG